MKFEEIKAGMRVRVLAKGIPKELVGTVDRVGEPISDSWPIVVKLDEPFDKSWGFGLGEWLRVAPDEVIGQIS